MAHKVKFTIQLGDEQREFIITDYSLDNLTEFEKDENLFYAWALWAFEFGGHEILKEGE